MVAVIGSAAVCSAVQCCSTILLQTILSLIYCLQLSPVHSSVQAKVAESWTIHPSLYLLQSLNLSRSVACS